jgi:hypothetical protein
MQSNPATLEQLKCIQQLLSQHPQMGQGVRNLAYSIASYDGTSAVRYVEFAIATRHLSPLYPTQKKGLAIA